MDAQRVQVRARIKNDLERLSRFAGKVPGVELPGIISTPHADYAFRIIVEQEVWTKIAAALAADIDYTNFKDEIHGEADRDATYFEVWSSMNDLQRTRARSQDSE